MNTDKKLTLGQLRAIADYIAPIPTPQEREATIQSLFEKLSRYDVSESQKQICGELKETFVNKNLKTK